METRAIRTRNLDLKGVRTVLSGIGAGENSRQNPRTTATVVRGHAGERRSRSRSRSESESRESRIRTNSTSSGTGVAPDLLGNSSQLPRSPSQCAARAQLRYSLTSAGSCVAAQFLRTQCPSLWGCAGGAMDPSEKERVEKAALRKRRQQGVAAGTSRFAELEQAVQEIRMNTLQVLKTPYYRNCKAARNIRRGMRVIRELCKQMRSETVTIGKERKEKGDGSATKRRKLVGAADPAGHLGMPSGSAGIDPVVGGSPAGVNFVLLSQNNNNNNNNPPVITELSDSP